MAVETISFNGKEYQMERAIFDSFASGVKQGYPTFTDEQRVPILADMLKAF